MLAAYAQTYLPHVSTPHTTRSTPTMAPTSTPTTPFPLYLLPSIPFRRRRSSAQSTSTLSSSTPSSSPPTPTSFLTSTPSTHLRCSKCLADLIPTTCIVSKGFTGRHGRAYLVSPPPPNSLLRPSSPSTSSSSPAKDLPNTATHRPVFRQLVTGAHTVSDISCVRCGSVLGWKYVDAEEDAQRYKIGKFILETGRVVKGGCTFEYSSQEDGGGDDGEGIAEEEVEFDSQDEDECEDLFSGVWSVELARRRRKNRAFK